jgi:hypothetical protein
MPAISSRAAIPADPVTLREPRGALHGATVTTTASSAQARSLRGVGTVTNILGLKQSEVVLVDIPVVIHMPPRGAP